MVQRSRREHGCNSVIAHGEVGQSQTRLPQGTNGLDAIVVRVTPAKLHLEIDAPARIVSERLNAPIETLIFCYPDGDWDDTVRDRVRNTGMRGAMAVKHDLTPPDGDPFALPRVSVSREQTRAMFMEASVGLTAWLKRYIPI